MNITATATVNTKDYPQQEDTLQLLNRMHDFDELFAELLEETEKAFQEVRLGFCAFMVSVVIPGVAAQGDQVREALQQAQREN